MAVSSSCDQNSIRQFGYIFRNINLLRKASALCRVKLPQQLRLICADDSAAATLRLGF
jgi:ABC-type lipoprotein export system ATPase subunit